MMLFLCIAGSPCFSQSLQKGKTYKFAIEKDGVYKITHDMLRKIAPELGAFDPATIKIFGNRGGMLPQANDAIRPINLHENAIVVTGQSDGSFDKDDFILFYAEGPDHAEFIAHRNIHFYSNNLYSDKNFYFLNVSDGTGKRINDSPSVDGSFSLINEYNDFAYHELDDSNVRSTGREWYGEKFDIITELDLKFNLTGIVPGSQIKIVSDVMGQTYADASFRIIMNNVQVGEQFILPIAAATYAIKGFDKRDTLIFNESDVNASSRSDQDVKYQFMKASGYSQGYLDYILISFRRALNIQTDQTIFTSPSSLNNATSTFQIGSASEVAGIWDITEPAQIKNQLFSLSETTVAFSTSTDVLKKFIAFRGEIPSPEFIGIVEQQNLHALSTPNLVIIAHPLFFNEAERLAAHRQNFNNWTTVIVTPEQIYNEFSSGRQDVSAIRDFVKMLYDKNPSELKALLLFGKGSYDYKDRVNNNTNFVATYESRNTLHPLQTYSSDDFYGFLEANEGEWNESPVKNHTLDIGVGRLPVTNVAQAKNVVDKIIEYDSNKSTRGYWQKEIAFVADDGSNSDGWTSLHQFQANSLASLVEEREPGIDTKKLFMGTYKKTVSAGSESVQPLTDDILRTFDKGALIINYTGHGSERIWADESVFTEQHIADLENKTYPFLVTATCEFGRQDDPSQTSSAELCVTAKGAGAIGMVTTARPVNSTTNFDLNRAFYEALFQRTNNVYPTIGEVFRNTKNNSISGVANRNFSLLGDPSMTLALPQNLIEITSIATTNGSDTLKALSKVTIAGQVNNSSGEKISAFNGILEAALYDKETDFVTIGRNKPAFGYKQWHNILFRGKATVRDGDFEFEFIVPKNISYAIAEGRLSLFAIDSKDKNEASGVSNDFMIGGGEIVFPADDKAPEIRAFIGDTTFINGGFAVSDTWLVARLSDESGINISDYGIGNSLIATLDNDGETFVLNSYYVADANNYRKGTIRFPMKGLSPGKHSLTLKAWDVYNNPAQTTIDFIVTEGDALAIESFGNYPNPASDNTMFYFTHNRSGDDLEAQLFIYSSTGIMIQAAKIPVSESDYRVDLMDLESLMQMRNSAETGEKLPAGIYFARLIVRSLANGSKNEHVAKLIILN
jgi:hypothetical protein